jgi:hypothetical protein
VPFSRATSQHLLPITINSYSIAERPGALDDSSFGLPTYFTPRLDAFVARAVILEL